MWAIWGNYFHKAVLPFSFSSFTVCLNLTEYKLLSMAVKHHHCLLEGRTSQPTTLLLHVNFKFTTRGRKTCVQKPFNPLHQVAMDCGNLPLRRHLILFFCLQLSFVVSAACWRTDLSKIIVMEFTQIRK